MNITATVLIFAVSLGFGRMGLTAEQCLMILAVCVVGSIVVWLIKVLNGMLREKRQRQIDRRNLLQYRNWHRMIELQGELQPIASPLLLAKDEKCLWMQNQVTLFEVRPVGHAVHTWGSMPLGEDGLRMGRAFSTSESTDEWRPIAEGQLYITNQQIYFDGDKQDRKIPLGSILTIKADASAIEVSSDSSQKSMVFIGCNGNICRELVLGLRSNSF